MKYKVGDKVLMNPKSIFAHQAKGASYGIILSFNNHNGRLFPYKVSWKNINDYQTHENSYKEDDLLPYQIVEKGDNLISSEGIFTVVEVFSKKIYIAEKKKSISESLSLSIPKEYLNTVFFKVEI